MRHIIEIEETVKIRHLIVVDIMSEGQLEEALDSVNGCCIYNIDEYADAISDVIPVLEVNENYFSDTESIEYFDDYMDKDDD